MANLIGALFVCAVEWARDRVARVGRTAVARRSPGKHGAEHGSVPVGVRRVPSWELDPMPAHVAERYTELDGEQFFVPLYVHMAEAQREVMEASQQLRAAREAGPGALEDAELRRRLRRGVAALLAFDGIDYPGERLRGAPAA